MKFSGYVWKGKGKNCFNFGSDLWMEIYGGNFQDMQDRAISVISRSFTCYWVMYHMVKQIYSFLNS